LSQSLAVNHQNHASLSALDVAAAVVLHLLVFACIAGIGLWRHRLTEFHPISVEVRLISARQLEIMQRHARHHTAPKRHVKPAPKRKPAPKPRVKLKPAHKPAIRGDRNFDPFKPLESETNRQTEPARTSPEAARVFQGQLSRQEMNRYVAMIQTAVQQHWKVPNIGKHVHDPLVEMILSPDGSVREIHILESSGNAALDASLIRAIEAASPFQVPREQFELFRNNKIRFHPLR